MLLIDAILHLKRDMPPPQILTFLLTFIPSSHEIQRSPRVKKQATECLAKLWIHPVCLNCIIIASIHGNPVLPCKAWIHIKPVIIPLPIIALKTSMLSCLNIILIKTSFQRQVSYIFSFKLAKSFTCTGRTHTHTLILMPISSTYLCPFC